MRLAALALAVFLSTDGRLAAEPQDLRNEPGAVELSANPITPGNPIPRRTLEVTPVYPPDAAAIDATGGVTVRVTLDELGRVAEVRRPSTPPLIFPGAPATTEQLVAAVEALLTATANAVRQWQYDAPAKPPVSFNVTIAFTPSGEPSLVSEDGSPQTGRTAASQPTPPPTFLDDPEWAEGAVRVGGEIRMPAKTRNVNPVYPPEARDARIQGVVIIDARIGEDGRVTKTRVRRSIRGLDQAALDAVAQWEFMPTLLDGQPLPVVMTVTINFSL